MADSFSGVGISRNAPAVSAAAITPADSTPLANVPRAIYIGGSGNVSVKMADNNSQVVFFGLSAGTVLSASVSYVNSTNTTATSLIALW